MIDQSVNLLCNSSRVEANKTTPLENRNEKDFLKWTTILYLSKIFDGLFYYIDVDPIEIMGERTYFFDASGFESGKITLSLEGHLALQ